jgi:hypothetical protein
LGHSCWDISQDIDGNVVLLATGGVSKFDGQSSPFFTTKQGPGEQDRKVFFFKSKIYVGTEQVFL